MKKSKNYIIRLLAFILFVIIPVYTVVKTPVLKQFYCSKADNKCILRVYNTFDKNPSTAKEVKISDIVRVQKGSCEELFGIYKNPCISVETLERSYVLDYSFTDKDTDVAIADFKNYLKDAKSKVYKLVADKSKDEINFQLSCWGVLILFGLLISVGLIADNKK